MSPQECKIVWCTQNQIEAGLSHECEESATESITWNMYVDD